MRSEFKVNLFFVLLFVILGVLIFYSSCEKKVPTPGPIEIITDIQPPAPGEDTDPAPKPCPGPCPCPKIVPVEPDTIAPTPAPVKPIKPMPPVCGPVKVLAFTADWCRPCQQAKPTLVKAQQAGLDIRIINIDREPALALQNGIKSVPTFIITQGRKTTRTNDISVVAALIPS